MTKKRKQEDSQKEKKLKDTINDRLFDLVKRELKNKDLPQGLQAKEMGISPASLSKYVNGSDIPNGLALKKIAEYYNVSADFLLGLSDSEAPSIDDREISEQLGLTDGSIERLKKKTKMDMPTPIGTYNQFNINDVINFLIENLGFILNLGFYFNSTSTFNKEKEIELENLYKNFDNDIKDFFYNKKPDIMEKIRKLEQEKNADIISLEKLKEQIKNNKDYYLNWVGNKYGKYKKN